MVYYTDSNIKQTNKVVKTTAIFQNKLDLLSNSGINHTKMGQNMTCNFRSLTQPEVIQKGNKY